MAMMNTRTSQMGRDAAPVRARLMNDEPVLPCEPVEERGLAHVWPAHHRHLDHLRAVQLRAKVIRNLRNLRPRNVVDALILGEGNLLHARIAQNMRKRSNVQLG
eukprot:555448-Pleurochrysis_carterae.AAC.1